jgi:hypothetical protein
MDLARLAGREHGFDHAHERGEAGAGRDEQALLAIVLEHELALRALHEHPVADLKLPEDRRELAFEDVTDEELVLAQVGGGEEMDMGRGSPCRRAPAPGWRTGRGRTEQLSSAHGADDETLGDHVPAAQPGVVRVLLAHAWTPVRAARGRAAEGGPMAAGGQYIGARRRKAE